MNKLKKRGMQFIIFIQYIFGAFLSIFYHKKYQDTWLISERGDEARDSGLVFYKYLKKQHRELNIKYVISKDSLDLKKIDPEDVIFYRSFQHIMYFINSKYLISTHIMGYSPEFGLFSKLDRKNFVWVRGKRIFLQHGIIYNFLKDLKNLKLDMFVCSTEEEQKYIIEQFGYTKEQVKCTGLARYDELKGEAENFILVFPTWRASLYYNDKNQFQTSEYFQKWNEFLQSEELEKFLKKNSTHLYFYPHKEAQKFCSCFHSESKEIVIASEKEYDLQQLLRKCKAYITDYSSSSFDIAYLRRPILYYQFDYHDFYHDHYEEGYLNLFENGLGKAAENLEDLMNELNKIGENDFKIEKKYEKRIEKFFKYHDHKQCERIYNEIIKLK